MQLHYKHTVAIIYTIVLFLDRLDLTIINVALPTIANYFGVAIIPFLVGVAIIPFLGGILLDYFGWRYIFLFSGPICLVLAIFGLIVLKQDTHRNIIPFDWIGFFVSVSLLLDIFFTLSLISSNGLHNTIFVGIIIFLILITCFICWERKVSYPLIDLLL